MIEHTTFWFVWNPQRRAPSYKHPSKESAKTEAERLARLNPGEEFIVLESVATCVSRGVVWEQHEMPVTRGPCNCGDPACQYGPEIDPDDDDLPF